MVTAVITFIGASAFDSMVPSYPLALHTVNALWPAVLLDPLQAGVIIWKLSPEVLGSIVVHSYYPLCTRTLYHFLALAARAAPGTYFTKTIGKYGAQHWKPRK